MWTVYDRPRDYPHSVVARKWLILRGREWMTSEMIVGPDLDSVRSQLPPHLFCLPRFERDDPCLVEVWL